MTATEAEQSPSSGDVTSTGDMISRPEQFITTSTGAVWLIAGGLLAATGIAVLAPMISLSLPSLAIGGIAVITALYLGMVLTRVVIPAGRLRLGLMAAGSLMIGCTGAICLAMITANEWGTSV